MFWCFPLLSLSLINHNESVLMSQSFQLSMFKSLCFMSSLHHTNILLGFKMPFGSKTFLMISILSGGLFFQSWKQKKFIFLICDKFRGGVQCVKDKGFHHQTKKSFDNHAPQLRAKFHEIQSFV